MENFAWLDYTELEIMNRDVSLNSTDISSLSFQNILLI